MLNKIKKFLKKADSNKGSFLVALAIIGAVTGLMGFLAAKKVSLAQETFNAVLGALFTFLQTLATSFLDFSAEFFGAVFKKNPELIKEMARRFEDIWMVFRDIGNMFIALGFVICGIGTALRIKEYEAKKMMIPLLLIAIFMNFTYHPLWTIVNASESITGALAVSARAITLNPAHNLSNIWAGAMGMSSWNFLAKNAMTLFITILWGMTYFTFAMLFIIRYSAFAFLIVVAPLAFACLALSFTQDIWKKWFSQFMTWCLMGIFLAGAVYISNMFYTIVRSQGVFTLNLSGDLSYFEPVIRDLFPLSALLIGFYLSGAGSLAGAKMITSGVVGMGAATAGMAVGGFAKAGGGIAGTAGGKLAGAGGAAGTIAKGAGFKPSGGAPATPGGALAGAPGGISGASGKAIPMGQSPAKTFGERIKRAFRTPLSRLSYAGYRAAGVTPPATGGKKAVAIGLGAGAASIIAPTARIGSNMGKNALRELSSQIVGTGKGVPGLGGKS